MECLRSFLGLNEDEARAEIATGRLKWAFDLRASGDKQFLRVLSAAMIDWKYPGQPVPADLNGVLELLIPASARLSGSVKSTTLQAALNVGSDHLRNLIRARRLRLAPKSRIRPGVPCLVTYASVSELMRTARQDLLDNLSFNTCAVARHLQPVSRAAAASISMTE